MASRAVLGPGQAAAYRSVSAKAVRMEMVGEGLRDRVARRWRRRDRRRNTRIPHVVGGSARSAPQEQGIEDCEAFVTNVEEILRTGPGSLWTLEPTEQRWAARAVRETPGRVGRFPWHGRP
jgi:hypothetical protein